MNKSLVAFPPTISTSISAISLELLIDRSCSHSHELCVVFRSSSSQTPATHRTEGLNFRHFPRAGILGVFTKEVFLHFHLQLVALYISSDLWPNFLCFQFADLSCCTCAQQQKNCTWLASHKKFRLFSILHSSKFCFVIFQG